MIVELDTAAKAIYLRLVAGHVAETREIAEPELLAADYNGTGDLLGIEIIGPGRFGPDLAEHPEIVILPARVPYVELNRGLSWVVETGSATGTRSLADQARLNAELNGALIDEVFASPWLLDRIAPGATVIPVREGDSSPSLGDAVDVARRLAQEGGDPILHILGLPVPERTAWQHAHRPQIAVSELNPAWPGDPRTVQPRLHYYADTDLLVLNFLPQRDAMPEDGRVVPIRDRETALLLVDLETREVVGRLVPRLRAFVVPNLPVAQSWLAQAEVRRQTPIALLHTLEDLGLGTEASDGDGIRTAQTVA